MNQIKLTIALFLGVAVNSFGAAAISWQTAGFAVNTNNDGQGPGTALGVPPVALPAGSLWQLIYSQDGMPNFNPANPTVPGGDDVVLASYNSIGSDASQTGIISGGGTPGAADPIVATYGGPGDFIGGNVYTRIFNTATPGDGNADNRYRDTGLLPSPGDGTPQPVLAFDVMNPAFGSTQTDLGPAIIEVNVPIPEPTTLAMFGVGMLVLLGFRRRD